MVDFGCEVVMRWHHEGVTNEATNTNAPVDTITIALDPWAMLKAEEAIRAHLPDGGCPEAQPFFDLMSRVHRATVKVEDMPAPGEQAPGSGPCVTLKPYRSRRHR